MYMYIYIHIAYSVARIMNMMQDSLTAAKKNVCVL